MTMTVSAFNSVIKAEYNKLAEQIQSNQAPQSDQSKEPGLFQSYLLAKLSAPLGKSVDDGKLS